MCVGRWGRREEEGEKVVREKLYFLLYFQFNKVFMLQLKLQVSAFGKAQECFPIQSRQSSCPFVFMARGPKSHCCWQNA